MLRKDKALLESLTRKYGKKGLLNELLNEDWVKKINTPKKKQFEANVKYLEDNYVGVEEEPCWDDLKYSRELYFETPSGGDFSITVEDLTREKVLDYLYDYDVDEAVELWWDAKNTPFSNIKDLYNDIEQWKKDFIDIAKGMPY